MRKLIFILCLTVLFSCQDDTLRLTTYEVHGIDVSHYQSYIDWEAVANEDITFAFVKAGEGITISDSLFSHNWKEMKRVGIIRGAYHFFRPEVSATKQAYSFIKNVRLESGDLPPVLDVEVTGNLSKKELVKSVKEWIIVIEKEYKTKPILYTNMKMYHKYFEGQLEDHPVWIARYNSRIPYLSPNKNWDFWQYGNRGRLAGIKGHVDFNVFRGTQHELEKMCVYYEPVLSFTKTQ